MHLALNYLQLSPPINIWSEEGVRNWCPVCRAPCSRPRPPERADWSIKNQRMSFAESKRPKVVHRVQRSAEVANKTLLQRTQPQPWPMHQMMPYQQQGLITIQPLDMGIIYLFINAPSTPRTIASNHSFVVLFQTLRASKKGSRFPFVWKAFLPNFTPIDFSFECTSNRALHLLVKSSLYQIWHLSSLSLVRFHLEIFLFYF